MPIRLSGMVSGIDTDAVVKELMSAQSLKKTKIEQKKTKAEWKEEKWAELNKKIYALYNKQVGKLKLQGTYLTKKVTSSNESAVTATANNIAAAGSHTIKVNQLASSQYVTGASVKDKNITKNSKLADLYKNTDGSSVGIEKGTIITVTVGDTTTKSLTVDADTTVSDFVATLQSAGLNASFDEAQGRFFISSKESGADNAFTITTSKYGQDSTVASNLSTTKADLKTAMGDKDSVLSSFYESYDSAVKDLTDKKSAYDTIMADDNATTDDKVAAWEAWQKAEEKLQKLEEDLVKVATDAADAAAMKTAKEAFIASYAENLETRDAEAYAKAQETVDKQFFVYKDNEKTTELTEDAEKKIEDALRKDAENLIKDRIAAGEFATIEEKEQAIEEKYKELVGNGDTATYEAKKAELYNEALDSAKKEKAKAYAATSEGQEEIAGLKEQDVIDDKKAEVEAAIEKYNIAIKDAQAVGAEKPEEVKSKLSVLGLADIKEVTAIDENGKEYTTVKALLADGSVDTSVSLVNASDAEIELDGAVLTGSSNSFNAAGMTFDLKNTTSSAVTLNVSSDVEGVYDTVKEFLKEYNSILEEMNTLYNATSAKGYEPLTDEEKEAMSEDQIKLWEDKIKDSLLRRDSSLGSLTNAMRSAMQTTVTVDGKSYSLASFGITTSSDYTEKGLLHIYGDEDDSTYATQTDKLKSAIREDADTVAKVLSGVIGKLSETMMDKMKKTSLSSSLTFYNDKQIKNQIDDYEDEIEKWEDRLKEMENRYYKQFSAMESAMAKMQSQSGYLSNLMGGTA